MRIINANNGFRFVFYFVVFLSFLSPKIGFYCRDRACPVSTEGAKNVKKRSTRYSHNYFLSNWGKLVYVSKSAAFIFKIKRSADFENKTSEK
jgi:hypothetical protein